MASSGDSQNVPVVKRQKVTTACDICRSKRIKCDGTQPECGPCRTRTNKSVRCSWDSSQSRIGGQASKDQILKLQQRIRELEKSGNTPKERINPPENNQGRPDTLHDSHDKVVQQNENFNSNARSAADFRLPQEHSFTFTASRQEPRRDLSNAPDLESPESAMVGAGEANAGTHGFFGGSSAGNFVTQIRKAIAQRMGSQNPISPSIHSQNSESSRGHARRGPWRTLSLDECALPPRSRADTLMAVYWDAVHPLYPFIDRVLMMAQYESLFSSQGSSDIDPSLLCALNLIFALSCALDTTTSAERRQNSAKVFFQRAQKTLDLWKMAASIESVQVLLLLGQYLQSTNEPLQCWIFVGSAIRVAQSLGLHLIEVSEGVESMREREIMRRIWHACILMDRVLAMAYGRPTMVSRAVASATPLPLAIDEENFSENEGFQVQAQAQPARLDFFVHSLTLYNIMEELLVTSNSNSAGRRYASKDMCNFNMLAADGTSFIDIDKKLMTWESTLPEHLKCVPTALQENRGQVSHLATVYVRQAVVLRQRYVGVLYSLLAAVGRRYATLNC